MHDSIILFFGNYSATAGPTIQIPMLGAIPIAPLAGSFLAIFVSVIIALVTIYLNRKSTERHIEAVEKASADQIKKTRNWTDLKRKQLIKALIQEFEMNDTIYKNLKENFKKYPYKGSGYTFIQTIIEKCLTDTPIDDDTINKDLLTLYTAMKLQNNRLNATRTPDISQDSLNNIYKDIFKYVDTNEESREGLIRRIKTYEENIKITI